MKKSDKKTNILKNNSQIIIDFENSVNNDKTINECKIVSLKEFRKLDDKRFIKMIANNTVSF